VSNIQITFTIFYRVLSQLYYGQIFIVRVGKLFFPFKFNVIKAMPEKSFLSSLIFFVRGGVYINNAQKFLIWQLNV